MKVNIFLFRRDLRLSDNIALNNALKSGRRVLPVFIFDDNILDELPETDARVAFIHSTLKEIDVQLKKLGSSLFVFKGKPIDIWHKITQKYDIEAVSWNRDYEPYAIKRDAEITHFLNQKNIQVKSFRDQVIFEPSEILKSDGNPYTIYTPFKKQWLLKLEKTEIIPETIPLKNEYFVQQKNNFPTLEEIGFKKSNISVPLANYDNIIDYEKYRDLPAIDRTTNLSTHLRFGTVSIREVFQKALQNDVFISELIWREFFMQILYFFPHVVTESFKKKYDAIKWRNNKKEFELWCNGETGYPIVDAGMRQLNQTGLMHNRVRMIVASFLTKHLLIDWRWGEAYFAEKLLDFELSSNNGNWQWAAGTGCDAAPYFRVFNPTTQQEKFDKNFEYIKRWLPEFLELSYIPPIVDHKFARKRAIDTYKSGLHNN
ncbi:MAG: deoxyribodipyrimidine photo-lyase [Bacteroidales bacterium]|nr:deoxyribodipyrimidine photo-lyase [Bacteroidales bacterium]